MACNSTYRGYAVLSAAVMAWLCLRGNPAWATVKTSPDVTIYNGEYPGWAWIDKSPGGQLLCVWREGDKHMYSAGGKVMLSQSADSGKTWSTAATIVDAPLIDDRNAAIAAFSNTDWMVCYNTYTSDALSQTMTTRTTDGGLSWSTPEAVSALDARTRAAPVKLSTGEILLPYYLAPGNQSLLARSTDNGQSWTTIEIPNYSGFVGDEWSILQMPDSSLAGIIRNSAANGDGSLYITKSEDRGLSWSAPAKTNLRDTSLINGPAQIFLQNEQPWVLYDDTRMVSVALATTSDPNLVSWNIDDRIAAYQYRADGTAIQDGGYPCSVALDGNRRFVVDYVIDGDTRAINGYIISVPETSSVTLLTGGMLAMLTGGFVRRFRPARLRPDFRGVIKCLAIIGAAIIACEHRIAGAEDSDRLLNNAERIIAVKGGGYFPVMIKLRDGSLGAAIRGGASHLGLTGRLDYIRSTDNGRTWTPPVVAIDSEWDDRNPALGQMPDGTLVLAYAELHGYRPDGTFDWNAGPCLPFFVTSSDGGLTWSQKRPLSAPWANASPFGKITVCKDGTTLLSLYQTPSDGVAILRSKDGGKTWGDASILPGNDETQIIELPDGRLLAFTRLEGQTDFGLLLSESDDKGYTWPRTRKLLKAMQWPFDATLLSNGNLLLSFGSRVGRYGAGAMLSRDLGKTWDEEHRMLLGWDSLSQDTGYPSTVQLDDETLVTMYYATGTAALPGEQAIVVRYTEKQLPEPVSP